MSCRAPILQVYNYTCCKPDQGPNGEPPGALTPSAWLFKTPREFRLALKWLSTRYSLQDIRITENGVSGPGEATATMPEVLNDVFRLDYYRCVECLASCPRGGWHRGYGDVQGKRGSLLPMRVDAGRASTGCWG